MTGCNSTATARPDATPTQIIDFPVSKRHPMAETLDLLTRYVPDVSMLTLSAIGDWLGEREVVEEWRLCLSPGDHVVQFIDWCGEGKGSWNNVCYFEIVGDAPDLERVYPDRNYKNPMHDLLRVSARDVSDEDDKEGYVYSPLDFDMKLSRTQWAALKRAKFPTQPEEFIRIMMETHSNSDLPSLSSGHARKLKSDKAEAKPRKNRDTTRDKRTRKSVA